MGKLSSLLWGAILGAGGMYFMDPQNGNRRKARLREQILRLQAKSDNAIEAAVSDLRQRASSVLSDSVERIESATNQSDQLAERVSARMNYLTPHPGAIRVHHEENKLVLEGDILSEDVRPLLDAISQIPGVQEVDNRLQIHSDPGDIAELQGDGWRLQRLDQWTPTTRFVVGMSGGYLLSYGMRRSGLIGFLAQIAGTALGIRALTAQKMSGMMNGQSIHFQKSIGIDVPVEQVYQLWSNFENFPRFMDSIEGIHNIGKDRSRWVVKGPAGTKVEFEAETTEKRPNQLIAWKTISDSPVQHQGQVQFKENGPTRTQVTVNMTYAPPAGIAGDAVAQLFGKDPKTEMNSDLARMKSLLEKGQTTAKNKVISRDEVLPVTGQEGNNPGPSAQPRQNRKASDRPDPSSEAPESHGE
jgi:uncharacterized membrane protein